MVVIVLINNRLKIHLEKIINVIIILYHIIKLWLLFMGVHSLFLFQILYKDIFVAYVLSISGIILNKRI